MKNLLLFALLQIFLFSSNLLAYIGWEELQLYNEKEVERTGTPINITDPDFELIKELIQKQLNADFVDFTPMKSDNPKTIETGKFSLKLKFGQKVITLWCNLALDDMRYILRGCIYPPEFTLADHLLSPYLFALWPATRFSDESNSSFKKNVDDHYNTLKYFLSSNKIELDIYKTEPNGEPEYKNAFSGNNSEEWLTYIIRKDGNVFLGPTREYNDISYPYTNWSMEFSALEINPKHKTLIDQVKSQKNFDWKLECDIKIEYEDVILYYCYYPVNQYSFASSEFYEKAGYKDHVFSIEDIINYLTGFFMNTASTFFYNGVANLFYKEIYFSQNSLQDFKLNDKSLPRLSSKLAFLTGVEIVSAKLKEPANCSNNSKEHCKVTFKIKGKRNSL